MLQQGRACPEELWEHLLNEEVSRGSRDSEGWRKMRWRDPSRWDGGFWGLGFSFVHVLSDRHIAWNLLVCVEMSELSVGIIVIWLLVAGFFKNF